MTKHSKFKRGSGVFACTVCGKQTRDVNGQNGQLRMCELCQAKEECGNSISDNTSHPEPWKLFKDCQTAAECNDLMIRTLAEYGS